MHNQGTAAVQRPEASSPPRPQHAALLQEVRGLREGIAEAERRIGNLRVMRLRELAGLPPVRPARPGAAAPEVSGPSPAAAPGSSPAAGSHREPEAEAGL